MGRQKKKKKEKNYYHGSSAATAMSTGLMLRLAFQSIGVVYGDVGTSPLYTVNSTLTKGTPTTNNLLGVISLIIYTLTLLPLLKYVFIVLKANDNGNGGTFALYSLLCRYARISLLPDHLHLPELLEPVPAEDEQITADGRARRAARIKQMLEGSRWARQLVLILTLLGTCALIGDGVLTPAISVLSAVGGVQGKFSSLGTNEVTLISIAILVALFCVQRFGTDKIGFMFSPCLLVWFLMIAGIGVYNVVTHGSTILRAFNPYYIYLFFAEMKEEAWIALGGVVLSITGTEAMFADLGHFSVASIQIAFTSVVYPSLLAAYLGQGAYLVQHPRDIAQVFYKSIPAPIYWPMLVVAVLAAIIASQAMISAAFSIVEQSQALGCFPRVKVVHTSSKLVGQVYIPEVNWLLMALCIMVTGVFKSTTLIGNAYGITVVAVMLVTTSLLTLVMLLVWRTALYKVVAFAAVFMAVELIYFSSNLYKFDQGGYIPVAFAVVLLLVMYVWHYVSIKKFRIESKESGSFLDCSSLKVEARVPGIGLVYTRLPEGVPPVYLHFVRNMAATHEVVVFVTLKSVPVARVADQDRFSVGRLGPATYRCVVAYGYMEGCHTSGTRRSCIRVQKESVVDHQLSSVASCCMSTDAFEEALLDSVERFVVGDVDRTINELSNPQYHECHQSDENACNYNVWPDLRTTTAASEFNGSVKHDDRLEIAVVAEEDVVRKPAADGDDIDGAQRWLRSSMEVELLRRSRRSGVTYMLGHANVRAAPGSSVFNRLVVDVLYNFLHRACRDAPLALSVPHKRLLEVGLVYDLE